MLTLGAGGAPPHIGNLKFRGVDLPNASGLPSDLPPGPVQRVGQLDGRDEAPAGARIRLSPGRSAGVFANWLALFNAGASIWRTQSGPGLSTASRDCRVIRPSTRRSRRRRQWAAMAYKGLSHADVLPALSPGPIRSKPATRVNVSCSPRGLVDPAAVSQLVIPPHASAFSLTLQGVASRELYRGDGGICSVCLNACGGRGPPR